MKRVKNISQRIYSTYRIQVEIGVVELEGGTRHVREFMRLPEWKAIW
jgi:hypothetical protein